MILYKQCQKVLRNTYFPYYEKNGYTHHSKTEIHKSIKKKINITDTSTVKERHCWHIYCWALCSAYIYTEIFIFIEFLSRNTVLETAFIT